MHIKNSGVKINEEEEKIKPNPELDNNLKEVLKILENKGIRVINKK